MPQEPGTTAAGRMSETLLQEFKRYVSFGAPDEGALRAFHAVAAPSFPAIAEVFYARILGHDGARRALVGGESQVGHLKVTLQRWMGEVLLGPWDERWFEDHCRIGRVHVHIDLPQHYMFAAMNVVREELAKVAATAATIDRAATREALDKVLDLELAIMLHTFREDLLAKAARSERLATFGQLVGSIGHELRNPLAVMETSLFLLKGRAAADETLKKHLGRIEDQVRLANGIISDLLEIIRDRPLNRERLDLGALVVEAASAVPRPDGVRLEVVGLPALPPVSADAGKLRQVFVNLVENAVHAAGERGAVFITGRAEAEALVVVVEDSGPGVDESVRARLFEPLITTKPTGVGLGLALAKRIAERHGGTVTYSTRDGGGARFSVWIPRS